MVSIYNCMISFRFFAINFILDVCLHILALVSVDLSMASKIKLEKSLFFRLLSRVTKQNRAAGVLENFTEGEKYAEHGLRKFVRNKKPEIMPSINSFFADPQNN
ncbi:OLC1v1012965C2 [Oldenlandia corymbosa var. corymbosa]|uniref:OLC1v1012965C2 n=1 Tax=Oldenlandia corymbosa var. corymbosa TaxID=529605 RepID=A0AAV1DX37_OLDCO|nr:OLC1v1012965C2 [Oldenlandia corymbosa var. corymbosa]